jgi:hypothetical protein
LSKKTTEWNPKITHVRKDGTVLDSMEGVVIPSDHRFYVVMAAIIRERIEKEKGVY